MNPYAVSAAPASSAAAASSCPSSFQETLNTYDAGQSEQYSGYYYFVARGGPDGGKACLGAAWLDFQLDLFLQAFAYLGWIAASLHHAYRKDIISYLKAARHACALLIANGWPAMIARSINMRGSSTSMETYRSHVNCLTCTRPLQNASLQGQLAVYAADICRGAVAPLRQLTDDT